MRSILERIPYSPWAKAKAKAKEERMLDEAEKAVARQKRENMIGAIVKAAYEHPAGALVVMKRGAKTSLARMMQCALPGCQKVSLKDYCCAEHCRKHKEMRRAK